MTVGILNEICLQKKKVVYDEKYAVSSLYINNKIKYIPAIYYKNLSPKQTGTSNVRNVAWILIAYKREINNNKTTRPKKKRTNHFSNVPRTKNEEQIPFTYKFYALFYIKPQQSLVTINLYHNKIKTKKDIKQLI